MGKRVILGSRVSLLASALLVCVFLVLSQAGSAAPAVRLNDSTVAFGTVPVGSTNTKSFTLTNHGDGATNLNVTVTGSHFTLVSAPASLEPGTSGTITVRYAPTSAGTHTGNVAVSSIYTSFAVSLSGTASSTPIISVSPTSSSFGSKHVGTSTTMYFNIANLGGEPLSGFASLSSDDHFSIHFSPYNVLPGEDWFLLVVYEPKTPGNHSVTITFSGGGGATVTVSGTAISPPIISANPTSLNFGEVNNGFSATQAVTITNTGSSQLSGAASVTGTGYSIVGSAAYNLTAGQSTTISVRFNPLQVGPHTGQLKLSNPAGEAHAAYLHLTGFGSRTLINNSSKGE